MVQLDLIVSAEFQGILRANVSQASAVEASVHGRAGSLRFWNNCNCDQC